MFFKSGVLARLEELRDAALSLSVAQLQRQCRWHLAQKEYYRRAYETEFITIVQDNVRQWIAMRSWSWFRLYSRLKPLMEGLKKNEQMEELEKKLKVVVVVDNGNESPRVFRRLRLLKKNKKKQDVD